MDAATRTLRNELSDLLGPAGLAAHGDEARYSRDWSGDHVGRPLLVVRPRTTSDVVAIMRRCAAAGAPVVPQGGHTGLVGGATPSENATEVVVSLERMNRVCRVDPLDFSMIVEAGCVLENIHRAADEHDLYFPLALAAQGSCQIGGNIATNAGGLNVLRYGMMRNLVLGLEVVLPDGRVYERLKGLRKDNTGYDLKQLFIGAEGTLGIVTAAALKLFPRPIRTETVILGFESVAAAVKLHSLARRDLGDLMSAYELMTRPGLEIAFAAAPDLREPFEPPAPVYVILEASTSAALDLRSLVEGFLEAGIESGAILGGSVAASGAQADDFWRIREAVIEGQVQRGRHLRTDVSVPISAVADFVSQAEKAVTDLDERALPLTYGHIGDGNVHLNVLPPSGLARDSAHALLDRCEEIVFDIVDRFGGSISAEHGIGSKKRAAFLKRISPVEYDLMHCLKSALDPDRIMSPGRVLD